MVVISYFLSELRSLKDNMEVYIEEMEFGWNRVHMRILMRTFFAIMMKYRAKRKSQHELRLQLEFKYELDRYLSNMIRESYSEKKRMHSSVQCKERYKAKIFYIEQILDLYDKCLVEKSSSTMFERFLCGLQYVVSVFVL